MQNILEPRKIKSITKPDVNFHIPSFQRGYRWDTSQVNDLMEDLNEFLEEKKSGETYCLQPIVVKDKDGKWEVIDGQQRLTTIFILLHRLSKNNPIIKPFSIDYETRDDISNFVEKLNGDLNNSNIDYYHVSNAYKVIDEWFQKKDDTTLEHKLWICLMDEVELIWYQINDDTNPIDVFTRLNVGKIPLTSSELVKALFLSSDNLKTSTSNFTNQNEVYLKQLEISGEWDRIEYGLQEPNFWAFISKGSTAYQTRIDFILELVSKAKKANKDDNYATFRFFHKRITNRKKDDVELSKFNERRKTIIDEEWSLIKDCYNTLFDWYNNHEYYHLIGYLISSGVSINDIYVDYKSSDKRKFKNLLTQKIKDGLEGVQLQNLQYGANNKELHKVLTLFNVISTLNINDDNIRFPFVKLNNQNITWSLEHIHAQNSEQLNKSEYKEWLSDHKNALIQKNSSNYSKLISEIDDFINEIETSGNRNINEIQFNELFRRIIEEFTSKDDVERELHDISNMALLDKDANSSLNNSVFEVKRSIIIKLEKEGVYIPISTRNVFLKYYSETPKHLGYWTREDRESYVKAIEEIVNPYLKLEEDESNK